MFARIYPWFVVLFWAATMSWLVVSKVLPPLLGGQPPDYSASLVPRAVRSEPVCWRIVWNDRRIGTAASQTRRRFGNRSAMRHVVHFERMPVQAMLSESLGLFGSAIKPLFGRDTNLEIDMLLATELRFDQQREFTDFQTKVDLGNLQEFLRIRGFVDQSQKLKLTTYLGGNNGSGQQVLNHELDLPRESLVTDIFAPRPELKRLRVGQRWTVPIYRPFPPNSPVQIVEAVAERLDVIVWDSQDVETILVVYREEAGSGLHASREPIAREWVSTDGSVLQYEVRISGLKLLFERLPESTLAPEIDMLDTDHSPRLWSR